MTTATDIQGIPDFNDDDLFKEDENCCPICCNPFGTEPDDVHQKIALKCQHNFCYNCLLESYRAVKCNFTTKTNNRICPYCRTPADYLPLPPGTVALKGIHREYGKKISHKPKPADFVQCLGILKSGPHMGQQCTCAAKPGTTYCGRHKPK